LAVLTRLMNIKHSEKENTIVDSNKVGEVWSVAQPGEDPVLYGHVSMEPSGEFPVRSFQTFRLTYTVGRFGLDDTGAIRVVFRAMGDWGRLQTKDPKAPNFVTATTDNGIHLQVDYSHYDTAPRPRWKSLTVRVTGGYLREGDLITIVFGDTSQGSPGMAMQTFVERQFEFKVLADVCAVGHYIPIPNTPNISIVPSVGVTWHAVLPSLRRPGERFQLGLKCEDEWGNPSPQAQGSFIFVTNLSVDGLQENFEYPLGQKSVTLENLSVNESGTLRIKVKDSSGVLVAESHPLVIREGQYSGYWGDLHGQSGESFGVTTSDEYFDFARNKSFLDITSHQANDFQVNNAFWAHLNELTAKYQEDGRFVTFPGYEWSGNTAVGGDRNVFFREEGRQIHRSSHALLTDRSDLGTDANNANVLFEKLADEDCVVYAHVGGRYADIAYAHDAKLERAMEIHSAWGTFEWMLTDGFALGHRCGVVCNSDGHKGRPGASYPGAGVFGAYGGLTCFLTEELTRDSIFDCLRRRHHYGTTGTRLHLDVRAFFAEESILYEQDPNVFPDAVGTPTKEVIMGDIVQTAMVSVKVQIEVEAQTPIERIEIRNGTEVIKTLRGYQPEDLGNRIRVVWSGAEYRGRGRTTFWQGCASFGGASIRNIAKINAWNLERKLEIKNNNTVIWDTVTTGNFGGFDVWLDAKGDENLDIATNHGNLSLPLAEVGFEDTIMAAGGLERKIRAFRLPETNPHRSIQETVEVPLTSPGDNPIWVCVTTEDGFQAWSSPIFIFN